MYHSGHVITKMSPDVKRVELCLRSSRGMGKKNKLQIHFDVSVVSVNDLPPNAARRYCVEDDVNFFYFSFFLFLLLPFYSLFFFSSFFSFVLFSISSYPIAIYITVWSFSNGLGEQNQKIKEIVIVLL
jgi:hypothetical protein